MNVVPGIDEVNLFKDDDTVIHFSNPKVQMSNGTNTFVVSGNAETKSIADIAPSILKQLNQEQLAKLLAQQQSAAAEGNMPGLVDDE